MDIGNDPAGDRSDLNCSTADALGQVYRVIVGGLELAGNVLAAVDAGDGHGLDGVDIALDGDLGLVGRVADLEGHGGGTGLGSGDHNTGGLAAVAGPVFVNIGGRVGVVALTHILYNGGAAGLDRGDLIGGTQVVDVDSADVAPGRVRAGLVDDNGGGENRCCEADNGHQGHHGDDSQHQSQRFASEVFH